MRHALRSKAPPAALVLIVALAGCGGSRQPRAPVAPLNFLLITLDTLRADRLGSYGYARASTPSLDRLASEGARFAQAISPVPLTLPAHSTILTGEFPMGHGVRDNGTFRLSAEKTTLAEILKDKGYETAAFISSFVIDSRFGLAQGFDVYYDFDEEPTASRTAMRGLSEVQRVGGATASKALDWLSTPRRAPFFLWIHLYDPHSPFEAPEPFGSRFADRPYDGEVAYTDTVVGQILDRLDSLGMTGTTLVVVVGDHGESLGEHGEQYHSWFIYDATLKVPFLVRLPGRIPEGLVIEEQVRLADLAPTALDLLAVPRDGWKGMQGTSLAALIVEDAWEGDLAPADADALRDLPAYSESLVAHLQFGWGELKAIRTHSYKYIDAPRPELYDLRRDAGETRNLASDNAPLATELRERLLDLEDRFRANDGDADAQDALIDDETLQRLRSLGYLAGPRAATNDELAAVDPKDRIGDYREFSATLSEAMEAIDSGRPGDAVRLLEPLARELPAHGLVHYHLGQAYLHQESYRQAVDELEIALGISPGFSQARADLAAAYTRTNEADRAVALLLEGLEEQPENPVLLFNLGRAYQALGSFDLALEAYRQIDELERSNPRVLSNMAALYLQTEEPVAAVARLEELVRVDPHDAMAWNNLGLARATAGLMEEAGAAFEKAVETAPDNIVFHRNLLLYYQRTGQHEKAEAESQKLRSLEKRSTGRSLR